MLSFFCYNVHVCVQTPILNKGILLPNKYIYYICVEGQREYDAIVIKSDFFSQLKVLLLFITCRLINVI